MYIKSLFIGCLLMLTTTIQASVSFKVDGIVYTVTGDNSVSVVYGGEEMSEEIVIPSTVTYRDGVYNVTAIGEGAFYNSTSLTSVTIPESIAAIGRGVFEGCSALTTVVLPATMTTLPERFFAGCSALESITLPESLTAIGMWAFRDCSSLTKIKLPEGVTTIGIGAFQNCTALRSISIPTTATIIDNLAFAGCTSLKYVTLPDNLQAMNYGVFQNCNVMTQVDIPASVVEMNDLGKAEKLRSISVNGDSIYPGLKDQTLYNNKKIGLYMKREIFDKEIYQNDPEWSAKFFFGYMVPLTMGASSVEIEKPGGIEYVNYKSFCVPFDVSFDLPENEGLHVYYSPGSIEEKYILMDEIKYVPSTDKNGGKHYQGVILEGTPGKTYYYVMKTDDYADTKNLLETNMLVGCTQETFVEPKEVRDGDTYQNYGLSSCYFRKYTTPGFITFNRAYLSLPVYSSDWEAKDIKIMFRDNDGTTHVADATDVFNENGQEGIYTLDGKKINNTTPDKKQVVIVKGKKILRR